MDHYIPTKNKFNVEAPAFEGDFLNRVKLEERLTRYIMRFQEGCVIGIDAPWGEGKTWFGMNWRKKLTENGFSTIWIDTFESDQSDDPFLTVTAEVWKTINKNKDLSEKFLDKAKAVGGAILPLAGRAAIGLAGKALLGMDLGEEYSKQISKATDEISKSTSKYLEEKIKAHESQKQDVVAFREALSNLVDTLDKPLVIFVDELDRCRPDYSVKVVERIKHFFDVPGIVFVLLYHKTQLEESVRGIYGQGIDAAQYLGKFVHFSMRLARKNSVDGIGTNSNTKYCLILAEKHSYPNNAITQELNESLGTFATWLRLSLRDIEKCYILHSLVAPNDSNPFISAWVLALKVGRPYIFMGILEDSKESHTEALTILERAKESSIDNWVLERLIEIHTACATGTTDKVSEDTKEVINLRNIPRVLKSVGQKFDLNID